MIVLDNIEQIMNIKPIPRDFGRAAMKRVIGDLLGMVVLFGLWAVVALWAMILQSLLG